MLLLACLSGLAGSGVMLLFAGTGGFPLDRCVVSWLTWIALATAVVMFITEWFSGLKVLGLIALAGTVFAAYANRDADPVSDLAVYGWTVSWAAVAAWFTILAGAGRRS